MNKVLEGLNAKQYGVFLLVLMYSLSITSLPSMSAFYIIGSLGGGIATASYGVSFSVLGSIVSKPLALTVGRKIGKIKFLKICIVASFVTMTPLIWLQDYYAYLVFRFINGLASGPIFLLVCGSCGQLLPKEKLAGFIQIVLIMLVAVPATSASMGAIISYENNWKTAFMILMCVPIVLLFLVSYFFKDADTPLTKDPIDWIGAFTFILGFTGLGFCLISAEVIDGFRSILFNWVLILSSFITLFFFLWSMWQPYPYIKLRLFKHPGFSLGMIHTFFVFLFFYAMVVLLSYWLHLYVNYSINWIALTLIILAIGPIALVYSFSVRETLQRVWIIRIAVFLLMLLSFYTSTFNVDINLSRIVLVKLVSGIAMSMYLPAIVYRIQNSCTHEEFPDGFCIFALSRMFGSFVGVAYFTMLWERRAVFYHSRLGGQLTRFSEQTQLVLQKLNFYRFTPLMKEEGLNIALERQSRALALNDCYYLIGGLAILLLVGTTIFSVIKRKELEIKT